jgi:surface antigen
MKKVIKFLSAVVVSAVLLTSCSNDEIQPISNTAGKAVITSQNTNELTNEEHLQLGSEGFQNAVAAVSYTPTPSQNNWTATSTIATGTSCAIFQAGLRAKVIAISGNKVTVQIQKGNGSVFGSTGTAYIKATSLCGNISGSSTIQSNFYYANVDFWCTFSSGNVSFSPSITLSNGVRMYAPMITITAKEMTPPALPTQIVASKLGGLSVGSLYGYVSGVAVYSNGPTANLNTYGANREGNVYFGEKWQCVEFMRRFYYKAYGFYISKTGNAKTFYGNSGLKSYPNGDSVAPQPGDILCMTNSGAGHVAIITEVGSNYIKVAHQNVGGASHIGLTLSMSGTNVNASAIGSSLSVQGWMRR